MILSYVLKHVIRNKSKSIYLIILPMLLSSLLFIYLYILDTYNNRINELYENMVIECSVISRENRKEKLEIPFYIVDDMQGRDFIKDIKLGMQEMVYYLNPFLGISASLNTMSYMYGVNDVEGFAPLVNGLIAITYGIGYTEDIFYGDEPYCIIDESLFEEYNLTYGDKITISASYNFDDIDNQKGYDLFIAGTYKVKLKELFYDFQPKDIIMPLDTLKKNFDKMYFFDPSASTHNHEYYSYFNFSLKDTKRYEEFLTYISKTDFVRDKHKVSEPKMAGLALNINDGPFLQSIAPLKDGVKLLIKLQTPIFITIYIVGGILPILIISGNRREMGILRSMGTKSYRIVLMNVIEYSLLMSLGISIVLMIGKLLRVGIMEQLLPYLMLYAGINIMSNGLFTFAICSRGVFDSLIVKE